MPPVLSDAGRLEAPMNGLEQRLRVAGRHLIVSTTRVSQYVRAGAKSPLLPRVFGNSMAKAGSHLLAQYLRGLSQVSSLVFFDPFPIRTITDKGRRRSEVEVLKDLRRWAPGEMRWGYLPGREAYIREILDGGRIVYFQYRDPRDKIVSHILYAMDMHKQHAMHGYYLGLPDMETRIEATIRGVPGLVQDIRSTYETYLAWLDQPGVLPVAFEDLIEQREQTLRRMIDHLDRAGIRLRADTPHALEILGTAMSPGRSPTYRAGRPGNWRDYFTQSNQRTFREVAGDLLDRLGYVS